MKILYFNDVPNEVLIDMLDYCHDNRLSLTHSECTDVSDVSGQWDTIASFTFEKDQDAMLFRLRYAIY